MNHKVIAIINRMRFKRITILPKHSLTTFGIIVPSLKSNYVNLKLNLIILAFVLRCNALQCSNVLLTKSKFLHFHAAQRSMKSTCTLLIFYRKLAQLGYCSTISTNFSMCTVFHSIQQMRRHCLRGNHQKAHKYIALALESS